MLFFLTVTTHSIFIIEISRQIQSYPDSNQPISLENVMFCMCIYLFYFFLFTISISHSCWYIPYINDFSHILIIELCRHYEKTKSLCAQFQSQSLEVYIDEVLIAEINTLQHCGLIMAFSLREDFHKGTSNLNSQQSITSSNSFIKFFATIDLWCLIHVKNMMTIWELQWLT